MIDGFVILAPLLLLPIVALFRFVGCGGAKFGDIHVFHFSVNCGGPENQDGGVFYYADDGSNDDPYVTAAFQSSGGSAFKLSGATPVTDSNGNPMGAEFRTCRTGSDFTFKFNLFPGVYRILLRFAEIGDAVNSGDRVFSFQFEEAGVVFGLPDGSNAAYDIVARAGGRLIARDEQVIFTAQHTVLSMRFQAGSGVHPNALVNAILVGQVEPVVISPAGTILLAGQTQQFQAVPAPGPEVTWEVNSPLADPVKGTISATGLYVAPTVFNPPIQEIVVASNISDFSGTEATGTAAATIYQPVDTQTRGKFKNIYGRDGFALANTPPDLVLPAFVEAFTVATLDGLGAVNVENHGTIDPGGILDPDGTGVRPNFMWTDVDGVHGLRFSFRLNDSNPHLFGIYCFDYDQQGRRQRIQMVPLDGGASQSLDLTVGGGTYVFWIARGRIQINVTKIPGSPGLNNVVNGIFFR